MKKILIVTLISLAASIVGCNSDDDLATREPETVIVNQFCYGPNATDTITVSQAFNNPTMAVGQNTFSTNVIITDDNFMLDMGQIAGTGKILFLRLTGNANIAIQTGLYNIDSAQVSGNARLSYSLDYDSTMQLNTSVAITSGLVRVTPISTGYAIEVDGLDTDGVRFHGNFVGRLNPTN